VLGDRVVDRPPHERIRPQILSGMRGRRQGDPDTTAI
jgi:hypothetical protein